MLQSAEESTIGAIMAGKRSQAPAMLSKARELQTQIEELQSGVQPLERALALVENEETEAAREAEEKRLAELRSKYRAAVGALIDSIETAGHDLAATIRIQEAEAALAVIAFQFPERKRPASVAIENPSTISCDEQVRLNLYARLCQDGYSDLFPAKHIARLRFEHTQAHDRQERERINKQQQRMRTLADSAIMPDTPAAIPNRQPKPMIFR